MIKVDEKSNFPYSYEEVDQLGLNTYNLMIRDEAEYAKFGVSRTKIDNFKVLSDLFRNRDFDQFYLNEQKSQTFEKDDLVEEIKTDLYNLESKVEWTWETKGASFKSLGLGALSKDTDSEVSNKAKLAVDMLTKYVTEFSEVGITPESLEALNTKIETLRLVLDKKRFAKVDRSVAQNKRVALANELYSEIVKYRQLGRRMWATRDYELAQSYIMPKKSYTLGGAEPDPDPDDGAEITIS